ncbi:hypothetical protein SKAU_G00161980 [Synaphobranchus kaupii]|uniref:Uncharacterized protein n=1 Tax=Synaphobranchus kaupii TaxID=118154 RepID=A0A9Q1IZI0_SYNKA|nr:hypothetical protein SKAU_G00161980 [Synaphobranchus kaupii]
MRESVYSVRCVSPRRPAEGTRRAATEAFQAIECEARLSRLGLTRHTTAALLWGGEESGYAPSCGVERPFHPSIQQGPRDADGEAPPTCLPRAIDGRFEEPAGWVLGVHGCGVYSRAEHSWRDTSVQLVEWQQAGHWVNSSNVPGSRQALMGLGWQLRLKRPDADSLLSALTMWDRPASARDALPTRSFSDMHTSLEPLCVRGLGQGSVREPDPLLQGGNGAHVFRGPSTLTIPKRDFWVMRSV